MVLGGPANTFPPVKCIVGLSEFRHALGLEHEHQGPAAAFSRLGKKLIKGFYKDEKFVNDNFLDRTEKDDNLKYHTNFDPESTYHDVGGDSPSIPMELILALLDTASLRNGKNRGR